MSAPKTPNSPPASVTTSDNSHLANKSIMHKATANVPSDPRYRNEGAKKSHSLLGHGNQVKLVVSKLSESAFCSGDCRWLKLFVMTKDRGPMVSSRGHLCSLVLAPVIGQCWTVDLKTISEESFINVPALPYVTKWANNLTDSHVFELPKKWPPKNVYYWTD